MPTTSSAAKVTTGTGVKTMLQIKPAVPVKIIEWGVSFDGSAAATPGICELIDTAAVGATVTAYAQADVMPFFDPNAPVNTSGTSGHAAEPGHRRVRVHLVGGRDDHRDPARGRATRRADEPELEAVPAGPRVRGAGRGLLRIRVNFGAAISCLCYVMFKAM